MEEKIDWRDQDTVNRVIQIDVDAENTFQPIFKKFRRCFDGVVSDLQISKELKDKFNEENRPYNSYNILSPIAKYLTSLERGQRKKVAALPRKPSGLEMALVVSKLIDCKLYNANHDVHKTRAFLDSTICGWGWLHGMWSFDSVKSGTWFEQAISPFDIKFDLSSRDMSLDRCKWIDYSPEMTLEEIVAQYAYNDSELLDEIMKEARQYFMPESKQRKKFISTIFQTLMDTAGSYLGHHESNHDSSTWFNSLNGKFKVIELHERRTERRMQVFDVKANKYNDITDDILGEDGYKEDNEAVKKIMEKYPNSPEPQWATIQQIWITTVVPALQLKVYDKPYAVQNNNFMFTLIPAYDFHDNMEHIQSPIEEVLDLQSDFNKEMSLRLELLLRAANRGYLVEGDAIGKDNERDFMSKKIGLYKKVNKISGIQEEKALQVPAELFSDPEMKKGLIEYISGSTREAAHGQSDNRKEGEGLFRLKQDASVGLVQCLFDNLDTGNIQYAENLFANVQVFMKMEDVIRITTDNENPEFIQINQPTFSIDQEGKLITKILNDVTIEKYDFVMSNQPYTRTARETEFLKLVEMFRFAIQVDSEYAKKLFPIVLKASDSPYRQEILEALGAIGEGKDKNEQMQQAMQALQMQFEHLKLDKAKSEVADRTATAIKKLSEAQGIGLDNEKESVMQYIDKLYMASQQEEAQNQMNGQQPAQQQNQIPQGQPKNVNELVQALQSQQQSQQMPMRT